MVTGLPCIAIDLAHCDGIGIGYGVFRYAMDLVRGLAALAPDARFLVIGSKARPVPELPPVFAGSSGRWCYVQLVPRDWRGGFLADQGAYARLLRRERASLFHSLHTFVPVLAPCPNVVTVHDLMIQMFPLYAGTARSWNWRFYRWGARRSAHLISVSETTAADVAQRWAPLRGALSVVPLGTAFGSPGAPAHQAAAPALRERLGSGPVIAAPFNLDPRKNLAVLLEAVARLKPGHPGIRLVAFGHAGYTDERAAALERRLDALCIRDAFVRTGLLDDADLAWLYRRAEVCVVPSLYEGFGLPALEAMAVGSCVVAGNGSATREVVAEGGVLVDTADEIALAGAIGGLLADPARRQALATRGRERAAAFTVERMARATWEVYRSVLRA